MRRPSTRLAVSTEARDAANGIAKAMQREQRYTVDKLLITVWRIVQKSKAKGMTPIQIEQAIFGKEE